MKDDIIDIENKLLEIWCHTGDKWMDAINKHKIDVFVKWFRKRNKFIK